MHITMVKKIKGDGSPCRKCEEIDGRLQDADLYQHIDEVVIADERDSESDGMKLAAKYEVDRAPFFIVEKKDQETRIYTSYFKFVNDVLKLKTSEKDEIDEIIDQNPDLDYI